MRTVPRNRRMAKTRCQHCGAERLIPDEAYTLGQTLFPYEGGGNHGHCLRCKRTHCLVIIEVPGQPEPSKQEGWIKIR